MALVEIDQEGLGCRQFHHLIKPFLFQKAFQFVIGPLWGVFFSPLPSFLSFASFIFQYVLLVVNYVLALIALFSVFLKSFIVSCLGGFLLRPERQDINP